jgi:hypothetical protein
MSSIHRAAERRTPIASCTGPQILERHEQLVEVAEKEDRCAREEPRPAPLGWHETTYHGEENGPHHAAEPFGDQRLAPAECTTSNEGRHQASDGQENRQVKVRVDRKPGHPTPVMKLKLASA